MLEVFLHISSPPPQQSDKTKHTRVIHPASASLPDLKQTVFSKYDQLISLALLQRDSGTGKSSGLVLRENRVHLKAVKHSIYILPAAPLSLLQFRAGKHRLVSVLFSRAAEFGEDLGNIQGGAQLLAETKHLAVKAKAPFRHGTCNIAGLTVLQTHVGVCYGFIHT